MAAHMTESQVESITAAAVAACKQRAECGGRRASPSHKAHHLLRLLHKWIIIILNLIFSPSRRRQKDEASGPVEIALIAQKYRWLLDALSLWACQEARYDRWWVCKKVWNDGGYLLSARVVLRLRDCLIKFCVRTNEKNNKKWYDLGHTNNAIYSSSSSAQATLLLLYVKHTICMSMCVCACVACTKTCVK